VWAFRIPGSDGNAPVNQTGLLILERVALLVPRHIRSSGRLVYLMLVPVAMPLAGPSARAQNNYEIQVYSSDTVEPHHTMVESHTNNTVEGSIGIVDGVLPTNGAWHETIEITHGFTDLFETGLYIFTSANHGYGWQYVGSHIRPRVRAPESWHWPVGVSLSLEFGYQRSIFSTDTWTLEIRPIIDQKRGRWYWSFNPAMDRSFHGPSVNKGVEFAPSFKLSYDITPKVAGGFEYYSSLGSLAGFDPLKDQQHQLFPTIDLNLSPKWEFNFGVGFGLTSSTDHLIVKMILGYRFDF
jgi:Putative MetA-pathway of phenol degradation